jgi:hypothetical protein
MGSPIVGNPGSVAVSGPSPCRLKTVEEVGQPVWYRATAGTIKLKIVAGSGTLQFDIANCAVTDSSGNQVNFNPTPTSTEVSFDVASGKRYIFSAAFIFTQRATATLVEDCTNQPSIDKLRAILVQAGRDYRINVA